MVRIELAGVRLPTSPRVDLASSLVFDRGGVHVLLGTAADRRSCVDVVAGTARPAAGRVLFDDCDVTREAPGRRNVTRTFACPVVYPRSSVRGNLDLARRGGGDDDHVQRVAATLGITGVLAERAGTLPPALRQRVALGRAFVRADAAAILLDDPLAAVGEPSRRELRAAIASLAAEVRATVVWTSGDVDDALTVARRVAVVADGRIVHDGPPDDLLRAPATTALATSVGDPPMNLLGCDLRGGILRVGTARLDLRAGVIGLARVDARLQVGVRPEELRIVPAPRPGSLIAQLQSVEHRGASKVATFHADDLTLLLLCSLSQQLVPGYRYHLEIPLECARIYADGVLVHG